MKRDDRDAASGGGQGRCRLAEEAVEPVELFVDRDPQRLESPSRRMDALLVAGDAGGARDDLRELGRRLDPRPLAGPADRAGDATGRALLAVLVDEVGELAFGERVDD